MKTYKVSFTVMDDGFEDFEKQKVKYLTKDAIRRMFNSKNMNLAAGISVIHLKVEEVRDDEH